MSDFSYTTTPPKPIVEAYLAQLLFEVKAPLDVVYHKQSQKLSQVEALVAAYSICRGEIGQAIELLTIGSRATLSPKHRACLEIMETFYEKLLKEDLVEIAPKRTTHGSILRFAKAYTSFIQTFHLALLEDTDKKERRELVKEYQSNAI